MIQYEKLNDTTVNIITSVSRTVNLDWLLREEQNLLRQQSDIDKKLAEVQAHIAECRKEGVLTASEKAGR